MKLLGKKQVQLRIKFCIWLIVIGLALSGITAFPLETELKFLAANTNGLIGTWINTVYHSIKETNQTYPWLSYGTDWLAFAHIMLAILFVGPLTNPIQNIWVIQFGIIVCILIFPLAFIAGEIRNIPLFWRLIDCSFGLIALIPLLVTHRLIKRLQIIN